MPPIKLICTDFDGTLVKGPIGSCTQDFSEVLLYQKKKGGAWAINTGRPFLYTLEGLEHFQAPFLPDYIITLEREVYFLSSSGKWEDFGEWNLVCRTRHQDMIRRYQDALISVCQQLTHRQNIKLIHEGELLFGLETANEEIMHDVAQELNRACKDFSEFAYQRNTVYLRFCHIDYNKGSALGELCRLINTDRTAVFAAGDNFNDISMLDGKHAAMCACPANAVDPVKQRVLESNGFVAAQSYASGVAESVQYFLQK